MGAASCRGNVRLRRKNKQADPERPACAKIAAERGALRRGGHAPGSALAVAANVRLEEGDALAVERGQAVLAGAGQVLPALHVAARDVGVTAG